MKIVCLGPEGTFTHNAAKLYGAQNDELVCAPSIYSVFSHIINKKADIGILPIENSIEGSVNATLDCLYNEKDVTIIDEIIIKIKQDLMAKSQDIRRIYSHPQAIGQCRQFICSRFPDIPVILTESTSRAAEIASQETGSAAIGSATFLAKMYGLKVIDKDIQDYENNFTRFVAVKQNGQSSLSANKTSIVFGIENKPGALCKTLELFSASGINISRIEPRPTQRLLGEYIFFIDISGGIQEIHIAQALQKVSCNSIYYRFLGSYKKGVELKE